MEIQTTTALRKIKKLDKRVRLIRGGSAAGKTICILILLIDYAIKNKNKTISVVTSTVPALRRGAYLDFEKILKAINRYKEEQHNKSLMRYTFTSGSYIEFFSTESEERLRGARRQVLYCNEANLITRDMYNALAIRTTEYIYCDWNPTSLFWADKDLVGQPDSDYITLTYKDNEALPDTVVKELEKAIPKAKTSEYWANFVRVYLEGQTGNLEGACIPEWYEIPEIPEDAKLLGYGLDFGYSVDSSSLVALYSYNDSYIFDEMLYRKGMLNSDISQFLKNNNVSDVVWADSSEPKSIQEISNYGHQILGVKKGRDSIVYGINLINQNKVYVTKKSKNLQQELRGYVWLKDKLGNTLQKPNPQNGDHAIDAARYVMMSVLDNPHKGEYYIY